MPEIIKSFQYPEVTFGTKTIPEHRMCSAGQKRATAEAYDLLNPGAPVGVSQTITRARRAENAFRLRADVSKHAIISWVVLDLFLKGNLLEYADREGNYLLQTYQGPQIPRNLFQDILADRVIF